MTVAFELPIRTQVRDSILAALRTIDTLPTVRVKHPELVTDYLDETQIKKAASYGVIVTDEAVEVNAQRSADTSLTVLIVVYVRSETDVRAMLDGAIEDIWEVLRSGQLVRDVIPYLRLEGIQANEGAVSAKPFAQAVMRWTARVRRSVSW